MPSGVYIRKPFTEERRTRMSTIAREHNVGKWMAGRRFTDEHKMKIGLGNKCKGRNKGFQHSEETKRKMSRIHEGKRNSKQHNDNIRRAKTGRKYSEGLRLKLSVVHKGLNSKRKHWNWQGGKSFEEYGQDFDSILKEQVRFRDYYRCRKCGCPQIENRRQLDIHHKDEDKNNNHIDNLITLCRSCHIKSHHEAR